MATRRATGGSRRAEVSRRRCPSALSLIELLVVLFIMGIMLGLLLPALSGARARVQATVCQNNIRQLNMALHSYIHTTHRFPVPNRWPVDVLRWIEEWPLAQEMKGNFDPNAEFPRPSLMRCPMQDDFPSRLPAVGFCHYVLVVDRPIRGKPEQVNWEIHDRELLSEQEPQEPWYIGPECSHFAQQSLIATKPGPHPPGLYMTAWGHYPR